MAAVAAALLACATTAGAEPNRSNEQLVTEERQSAQRLTAAAEASRFVPVAPRRVLDTRSSGVPVGHGATVTVDLSGQTPATATSVVLNVTGTQPTAATYVAVYSSDESLPESSNLNLLRGQTRANAATVALSQNRTVTLFNRAGSTHLVVDLAGFYATDQGAGFTAQAPARALDTRSRAPVGPRGVVNVNLNLPSPDRPSAVVLNVTAVQATTNTFVTAYTAGQPVPLASSLNLGPGEAVPNQVTVPLDTGRTVTLFNGNGTVHLIVDVVGYYRDGSGSDYVSALPLRVMDTRPDHSGLHPDSAGISLTGWGEDIDAVAANLTGTNATAAQYVVAWPGGSARPNASNLNLVRGQTVANAVTVGIGYETMHDDYAVNFVNNAGYVDLIFDVAGFFITTT
ncbi:MAG: hypothetical protein WBA97_35990 [Actinophytocola sp.]|uniref:hypothetical protein n=1 Tax=Actinophytocola sp. TaxID=1872138 RepID=UPI003C730DAB